MKISLSQDDSGWPGPDDCGGFAQLHLSAKEMAQYWTAVRFNDDIVSDDDRSNMRNRAGLWNRLRVTDGTAYGHAGGWYWNGRETTTCLLEFPNNLVASIILNSESSLHGCASLRDAYNSGF